MEWTIQTIRTSDADRADDPSICISDTNRVNNLGTRIPDAKSDKGTDDPGT